MAETAAAEALKKTAAKRAWDFGDKARQLAPNAPEGHYYAAAGVGLFGQAMGVMTAISAGVDGKFNDRLDKAIQIDPAIEGGGPWLARGRYYYEVPFFMRDLKKSATFLGKALERHPENLRARWYMAQTLLKDGQARKAKAEIDFVLSGDESYDPPDARRVKALAAQTAQDIAAALK
jgi:pimeloyl-ACP methyl ester carboxylesterase